MEKVVIGDCELYCGDCLEVLPQLEQGAADAVITDPPYGIGYGKYESHDDDPEEYPHMISTSLPLWERIVETGWICVFQAAKTASKWAEWFPRDFRPIALPKTFVQILPTLGPTWSTDYALLWSRGEPSQRGKSRDWFVCPTSDMSKRPKGHPCPRPLVGIKHCVDMLTEKGQKVLDPFLGSGTTLVAAAEMGRGGIGIEIEPKYFDIACRRIEKAVADQKDDLFPAAEPLRHAVQGTIWE